MSKKQNTPIKILTPYRAINQDNWPGEVPVEFLYFDDTPSLIAQLPEAHVLISIAFTKEMGEVATQLGMITGTAGTDGIDFEAVPEGWLVANVYEHEIPINGSSWS